MKCKQCGKENADNEKYCFYCGTDLTFETFEDTEQQISADSIISGQDLSVNVKNRQNKKKSYKKVIVVSILLSVAILVGSLSFLIHRLSAVNNINSNRQFHQNSKVSEGVDNDSSYSSEMTDKKENNDLEDKNSDSLAAVIEYETMQALESATYFKKAFASSVLPDQDGHNYDPSNVLREDGTCWCEDASGYGEGEWIQLDLPELQRVSGLHLINGYAGTEKQYDYNSKISRLRLDFSDGNSTTVDLQVFKTSQRKTIQNITLSKPVETEYVRITILSVKSGNCKDTCLTFVEPY